MQNCVVPWMWQPETAVIAVAVAADKDAMSEGGGVEDAWQWTMPKNKVALRMNDVTAILVADAIRNQGTREDKIDFVMEIYKSGRVERARCGIIVATEGHSQEWSAVSPLNRAGGDNRRQIISC